jgi:hypothetical protein
MMNSLYDNTALTSDQWRLKYINGPFVSALFYEKNTHKTLFHIAVRFSCAM